jgi:hypothetical protein
METAFGSALYRDRVRTDSEAASAVGRQNTRAFTVDQSILFGAGEFSPGTPGGQRLLAHEIAHTIQQQGGSTEARTQTYAAPAAYEREAEAASVDAGFGFPVERLTPAPIGVQSAGMGDVHVAEGQADRQARQQLAQTAGRLLLIDMHTEQMRPLFMADLNLKSQYDMLRDHIDYVTSLLQRATQSSPIDVNLLRAAEVCVDLAGLAYDLMRADREATAHGIAGVVRASTNRGLAWIWEGMRELKTDPLWAVTQARHAQIVLSRAEVHRDNVLRVAPIANVMKAGVTAASMASAAWSLAQATAAGINALGRVADWMRGMSLQVGAVALEGGLGGMSIGMRIVSAGGSIALTADEVAALAEAGVISSSTLNLYMMARAQTGVTAPSSPRIGGTRGLDHSFDEHASQWFGRLVGRDTHLGPWRALIEQAAKSGEVFEWSLGGQRTVAQLARIEGKYFVVQFFAEGPRAGELATAFVPNQSQLTAMLRLLGH